MIVWLSPTEWHDIIDGIRQFPMQARRGCRRLPQGFQDSLTATCSVWLNTPEKTTLPPARHQGLTMVECSTALDKPHPPSLPRHFCASGGFEVGAASARD
jgi:hypothetical protein